MQRLGEILRTNGSNRHLQVRPPLPGPHPRLPPSSVLFTFPSLPSPLPLGAPLLLPAPQPIANIPPQFQLPCNFSLAPETTRDPHGPSVHSQQHHLVPSFTSAPPEQSHPQPCEQPSPLPPTPRSLLPFFHSQGARALSSWGLAAPLHECSPTHTPFKSLNPQIRLISCSVAEAFERVLSLEGSPSKCSVIF